MKWKVHLNKMKKEKRKFPFTMKTSSSSMQVPLKKQSNYYLSYILILTGLIQKIFR
ncbi:unnamed protein product [Callosobruchus maculatus]|uniref:Uncharacterized protein n=1 Tax=Callosobruchus maculatus TaxID=64391 RepID=A0A653BTQ0_CALMS|nr:unnamed protein product [Callosobruchus maculatus]